MTGLLPTEAPAACRMTSGSRRSTALTRLIPTTSVKAKAIAGNINGVVLPSGLVFPAQAPDWWAERVHAYELQHPVEHVAPGTSSPQKSRPARTRKTRSTSSKKATSNREGKKKVPTSPPHASSTVESPRASPRTVPERTSLKTSPSLVLMASPSLDVDPTSLSQQAIKHRLETLERQRAHYLREYSRSTREALDISIGLNQNFSEDDTHFNRDMTLVTLHCTQESLVAVRIDGAYLTIVSRDIARFRAALDNGPSAQSADEEEVAAAIAPEQFPTEEGPTGKGGEASHAEPLRA
ncbi:hypothetical protein C8Q78DRAFT_988369 [Trametes maxima]|nr:hypothetical protein C8Q78DRAFT_988369 [Trametes maxima]